MKSKNKILAALLAVTMLICMTGFTANAATQAASITFSKTFDAKVQVGYAITRTAITTPEGLAVTYASSDTSIVTVSESGKVVGKKPGNAIITASADGLRTSYNVTVVKADDVTASTKIFEGYNVTILDKATPAVSVRGRTNDRNVMCFVSAANQEVGAISHSDYNAIIQKNRKVVNLPGGGTYGAPPVDGKSWEDWFADEFNKYRALASGSREEAVATNNAETIEKYRQDVIRLVNEEREKAGLPAFESHEAIMDFAQVRAEELVDNYSHTRPDGSGAGTENAARGQMTPTEVVTAWMDSARHKANILKPANDPQNGIVSFTHIGVGCYRPSGSSGGYYWVLTFGYGPDSYSSGY